MPYIKSRDRHELAVGFSPESPGDLNYCITRFMIDYIQVNGESYQSYNDIVGALECAKLELYRRKIVPYEDKKIEENGDVYE